MSQHRMWVVESKDKNCLPLGVSLVKRSHSSRFGEEGLGAGNDVQKGEDLGFGDSFKGLHIVNTSHSGSQFTCRLNS